ncbi:hypothetical protein [Novosphingobium sp. B1]|uniref:hypothetical protein n=1 Tax=Novosphingobium sp. B1 TaxID=1938756 RepID=UPI0009D859D4|nr:hypothetical protein [Novosphingobium sp. B1]SMC30707.1 hypothetical protein SAMN06272759_101174 [Novosphingobium sp. B1]
MSHANLDLTARVVRLLDRAVKDSGKPVSEIARLAEMKRDSLRRSVAGERVPTLSEVLRILEACEHAGEETLLLLLLVGEDFALSYRGSAPARFLGELFKRAPAEIIEQLGELASELRPRWANGTAKLLARTLEQHITDLNRRGDAIGDRIAHGSP